MITRSTLRLETTIWQKLLARSITEPAELLQLLNLDPALLPAARLAAARFPLRVTRHFVDLMEKGNPEDPLLRQVLPLADEMASNSGYIKDPVGDLHASLGNGLLQKYAGRALLLATGACAVHCRYCFRRHYPYNKDNAMRHWQNMLQKLHEMHDISEIILSGGDPLSLSDHRLFELLDQLERLPHIRRLRFHSRLPVVLPERITAELTQRLAASRLHCSLVLHINHANELDKKLHEALLPLRRSGVTLLNQSVLLSGVNDDLVTLQTLSEALFAHGILPYYLHRLDPVEGAAHFFVGQSLAGKLQQQLTESLPGYLVPRFVEEIPGAASKTAIVNL